MNTEAPASESADGTQPPSGRVPHYVKQAGVNVDHVDVAVGCRRAAELGYDSKTEQMAIELALNLWRRGEEDKGRRMLMNDAGMDLTTVYMVLAAAITSGNEKAAAQA